MKPLTEAHFSILLSVGLISPKFNAIWPCHSKGVHEIPMGILSIRS